MTLSLYTYNIVQFFFYYCYLQDLSYNDDLLSGQCSECCLYLSLYHNLNEDCLHRTEIVNKNYSIHFTTVIGYEVRVCIIFNK